MQERLLACVVRLPMSFFDSQPTGRLLNRFTKDTGEQRCMSRRDGLSRGAATWGGPAAVAPMPAAGGCGGRLPGTACGCAPPPARAPAPPPLTPHPLLRRVRGYGAAELGVLLPQLRCQVRWQRKGLLRRGRPSAGCAPAEAGRCRPRCLRKRASLCSAIPGCCPSLSPGLAAAHGWWFRMHCPHAHAPPACLQRGVVPGGGGGGVSWHPGSHPAPLRLLLLHPGEHRCCLLGVVVLVAAADCRLSLVGRLAAVSCAGLECTRQTLPLWLLPLTWPARIHPPPPCLQTRYIRSSREIKRLDSLALSPIFGHFGETLQVGVP